MTPGESSRAPPRASAPEPRLFALDDAECSRLAEEHGTPVFVYHGPTARASYLRLREALPERVRIAYGVKSNPFPRLLETLAELGASFDCASLGELDRIAALDLPPGRVFYAGPGKRLEELERALALGVRVQAEGWEDLERLESLASETFDVNLRVHPSEGVSEVRRILGGVGPSAFGIDEEDLASIVARAEELERVRIRGLHVFAASNERDAARLLATHRVVFRIARKLRDLGVTLDQVDVGGGLGVPYAPDETPLDLAALGEGIHSILAEESWFEGEVIVEPGRILSAPCGVYLARVVRIKDSRGTRFAILEGGVNHLMRPLLTGQPFPVRRVGSDAAPGAPEPYTLAGPLCTSLDRLGEVMLPPLAAGDLLAFGMTGGYGFTEGMTHFLSHPPPPEVWIE